MAHIDPVAEYLFTWRRSVTLGCLFVLAWMSSFGASVLAAQISQETQGQAEAQPAEVVVTARRRAEDVTKVPAVVAAFSQAQLDERGIVDQTDLQTAVPGLIVRQTESSNYLNYVIRGQTVDNFSGTPTAVVPYINEVQFAPGGLSSFFDVQSIQVLKGPQGTLFGRNATGGAVLVTTAKPAADLTGRIELSGGNYGYFDAQGMINLPIVPDKVLLRGAFDILRRGGFQYNLFNGQHPGAQTRNVGRVSLTLRPTEGIENTTAGQFEAAGGNNSSSVVYSYNRCGQLAPDGRPLNCAAQFLFGPQLDQNVGFPGAWAAYLAAHPKANPGGIAAAALAQRAQYKFWQVDEYSPVAHRGRNWFVTNTTTAQLGKDIQVKNIAGASRSHATDLAAEVGTPFLILQTYNALQGPPSLESNANDEIVETISEEPQLQGKYFDGSLAHIVGAYFQRTRSQTDYPATYTDVAPIIPPTAANSIWKQTDTTRALYTHGSFDLGAVGVKNLTFSAGARYAWDTVTSDQLPGSRFYPGPHLEVSFHKPSWNAGLEYQVTPELMTYLESRGSWRSGGINGIAPPVLGTAAAGGSLFLPETTYDVELGAKWSGELAGRQAHLFVAAYNQWVNNIQRAQLIDLNGLPLLFTVNVPSARIRGMELDTSVRPVDRLQLGLTAAYTSAAYIDNQVTAFGQTYAFGPYADSPAWTGTVYGQVMLPVPASLGNATLRADVYAQTGSYISNTASTRTPGTYLPGYSVTNLRFDWKDVLRQRGAAVSLFVRNLFNKGYYVGGISLGDVLGVNSANVGEPRMWGAEVKYGF